MRRNPLYRPEADPLPWYARWSEPRVPWPGFWPTAIMLAYLLAGTPSSQVIAFVLWAVYFLIKALLWADSGR